MEDVEEQENKITANSVPVRSEYLFCFYLVTYLFMTFLLPGQPVPVRATTIGPGVYLKHGQLRASLAGTLADDPPAIHRQRPHPPAPNALVLGTVTRLSPLQAVVAISVVDGTPLPPGEEFTGVIRTQDIRATEKDRVKIADCFRGGDVVKGLVVGRILSLCASSDHAEFRSPLEMRAATTSLLHATTSASSLPRARLVGAFPRHALCCSYVYPGATMEPVSWQEMRCPRTGRIEKRKCAKPETL